MMKKRLLLLLAAIVIVSLAACGSSNVVDYTGKDEPKETEAQEEAPDEPEDEEQTAFDNDAGEEEQEETAAEEPASYEADIVLFNIYEDEFDDGYSYDAIVEFENTGDKNIYLAGTAFDIEDAGGSLVQSDDFISSCPDVIKPGEKGYLYNQFGSSLEGVSDIEGLRLVPQYVVKTTNKTPHEYEVTDVSVKKDDFGITAVGRVTNDTDTDQSLMYIQIMYYDSENNILGISGTNITDFLAGRTVSFEISGIGMSDGFSIDDIGGYKIIAREMFFGF